MRVTNVTSVTSVTRCDVLYRTVSPIFRTVCDNALSVSPPTSTGLEAKKRSHKFKGEKGPTRLSARRGPSDRGLNKHGDPFLLWGKSKCGGEEKGKEKSRRTKEEYQSRWRSNESSTSDGSTPQVPAPDPTCTLHY